MHHLHRHRHETYRTESFFAASAVFQVLASARDHVPVQTCLQAVRDGWVTDPDEQVDGRSVLLSYLGTFEGPSHRAPEQAHGWQDEQRDSWRMATALPLGQTLSHLQFSGQADRAELTDPMGPPVPAVPVEVALRLLAQGANPWAQDRDGRDALDQAFSLGWTPVWTTMLARADAPAFGEVQQRTQRVAFLTRPDPSNPGQRIAQELPWLHASCALGHEAALGHLLDHGFDVNQRDAHGRTPLFYAQFPGTVELLLERGADPLAMDAQGRSIGTVWAGQVAQSTALSAMNTLLNQRLKPLFDANPEALRTMHRPALYDLAATGTKDNVLRFLRSNGMTVNDRHGDGSSLLTHAILGTLRDHNRQPALMMHLLDRVEDPWHAGLAGVPDVVLAWFAAQHNQLSSAHAARQAVGQRLQERYDWSTPRGYAAFMRAIDEAAQALVSAQPRLTASVADALAQGLERSLYGDVLPETRTEKAQTRVVAPAAWERVKDADGNSCGWTLGARMAHLMLRSAREHTNLPQSLGVALRGLLDHQDQASMNKPWVPLDAMAMHALLVPLGDLNRDRHRPERWGFQRDNVFHVAFQLGVAQGLDLDPAREGFEAALAQIRLQNPTVALAVENAALRKGLEDVLRDTSPSPRSSRRRM